MYTLGRKFMFSRGILSVCIHQASPGEEVMLRTITVGNYVQIQGLFVKELENGRVVVSVDDRLYEGKPVVKRPN